MNVDTTLLGEALLGDFDLGGAIVVDVVGTITPVVIDGALRSGHVTVGLRHQAVTVGLRSDRLSCAMRDLAVALDGRSGGVESDLDEALVLA